MIGIEEVEVVAYVGCESRITREGHENGGEYLVFAETASDADKLESIAGRMTDGYKRGAGDE